MHLGRFFVPTLPLLVTFAVLGARGLRAGASRRMRAAVFGTALLASLWPQLLRGTLFALHAQNEARWICIGKSLKVRARLDTPVAAAPIGAIGYFSELPILDTIGVTNDVILRAEPELSDRLKGHHRHDPEWVLAREPSRPSAGTGCCPRCRASRRATRRWPCPSKAVIRWSSSCARAPSRHAARSRSGRGRVS